MNFLNDKYRDLQVRHGCDPCALFSTSVARPWFSVMISPCPPALIPPPPFQAFLRLLTSDFLGFWMAATNPFS